MRNTNVGVGDWTLAFAAAALVYCALEYSAIDLKWLGTDSDVFCSDTALYFQCACEDIILANLHKSIER